MRVFISTLTMYDYGEDIRVKLNMEEVRKFTEAMNFAGEYDRGIVFSDYHRDELETRAALLTHEESEIYRDLLSKIEDFKFLKVNLNDYQNSYSTMYDVLYDLLKSHVKKESVELKVNVSCGHKLGSLALYLSLMSVVHSKELYRYLSSRNSNSLFVDVYHAERNIEKLPVMHFESVERRSWESYLITLKNGLSLEEFERRIKKDAENPDKIITYFKKCGYIEMRGDTLHLTKKGRTLADLLERLDSH